MGCLAYVALAVIALPIWVIWSITKRQRQAAAVEDFRRRVNLAETALVGKAAGSKLDILNAVSDLLCPMYLAGGIEGAVCLYIGADSRILDVQHWVGDSCSVPMPPEDIRLRACALHARGVAVAHNHPNPCVTPSDQDVWHSAGLMATLQSDGIALIESYVWCGNKFKSVLNTRRYKDLTRTSF